MTEPTTEAGRRLLEFLYPQHGGSMRTDAVAARIIAIEAEARASLDVDVLAPPNPWDEGSHSTAEAMMAVGWEKYRAALRAILAERKP